MVTWFSPPLASASSAAAAGDPRMGVDGSAAGRRADDPGTEVSSPPSAPLLPEQAPAAVSESFDAAAGVQSAGGGRAGGEGRERAGTWRNLPSVVTWLSLGQCRREGGGQGRKLRRLKLTASQVGDVQWGLGTWCQMLLSSLLLSFLGYRNTFASPALGMGYER